MTLAGHKRAPAASPPMSGRGTADRVEGDGISFPLSLNARVVLARLECARSRSELVDALAYDLGFELRELARLVGGDIDVFARWDAKDNPPAAERLDDLGDLAERLIRSGKFHPDLATGWLRSRNRVLNWQRPLDALRDQGYLPVRSAVDAALELT
jgi:hypothetical protein